MWLRALACLHPPSSRTSGGRLCNHCSHSGRTDQPGRAVRSSSWSCCDRWHLRSGFEKEINRISGVRATFERVTRPTLTAPRQRGVEWRVLVGIGLILAIYLVVRGMAEPLVIDVNDPDSYRSDWGGPSLIGVLAVHSGPALGILTAAVGWFVRRRGRSASEADHP
jgi:hypothetical protein